MNQEDVFNRIEAAIVEGQKLKDKPFRIAINGIEGAGKTTFAAVLSEFLITQGHQAIHVSIDGFHFNKAHRYRQGRDSAKGYYEDSYDEQAFVKNVLLASQAEPPCYKTATHDLSTDEYLNEPALPLENQTILITDGAYLFKPTYLPHWDLKIYLKVDFEIAKRRGAERDAASLGGYHEAEEKFEKRYHAASKLYINACAPESQADLLLDMNDFENIRIIEINKI